MVPERKLQIHAISLYSFNNEREQILAGCQVSVTYIFIVREKKPTKNVVISERDYKNLVTAARDNDRLKQHVRNLMSTDMAREYKKLSKEHGQVKEKYSGLVERFNENVNDYNELLEENSKR